MIVEEERRKVFYDGLKEARLSLIRVQPGEVTMGRSERVPKRIKFVPRVYGYGGVFRGAAIKLENLWVVPWLPRKPRKQQPLHRKENSLREFRFPPAQREREATNYQVRPPVFPLPRSVDLSTNSVSFFQTNSIIKYLSITRRSFDILINLSSTKMFVKSILQYFIYPSFIISLLITNLGFIYI